MSGIKKIGFFSAFIIPALLVTGYYIGSWGNFLTIIFSFLVIPVLDLIAGKDPNNVKDEEIPFISKKFYYRLIIYIWVYVQLAVIIWAFYVVSFGSLNSWFEWTGFVFSFSLVSGGIGITVAHELGHKKSKLERFYSKVLLMTVSYMHFYIAHNKGHHVQVATREDPATARYGESFYAFWWRSVFGSYIEAWKLEFRRLERKGYAKWGYHNQMIWFAVLPLLFCGLATLAFSVLAGQILWVIPAFFFGQSILAFTLLELVNYVEHYGILRKEIAPGKYERVDPSHSWNANHLLSNFFLFQLQRHSDHHVHAIRRYQALKHYDSSPQLPAGYPTMILLSLLPPLWFRIVDPILNDYQLKRQLVN